MKLPTVASAQFDVDGGHVWLMMIVKIRKPYNTHIENMQTQHTLWDSNLEPCCEETVLTILFLDNTSDSLININRAVSVEGMVGIGCWSNLILHNN